ncbi:MAG: sugar phosphate isomerase/epimerase [Phycisphaeraceae bacterium]
MSRTRTGHFPIGFRQAFEPWQHDVPGIAAWARDNDFEVIDLTGQFADQRQTVQHAGLAIGTLDLPTWQPMMSADEGKRRDTVAKQAAFVKEHAAAGVKHYFAVFLPEDPQRKRAENFEVLVKSLAELAPALEQAGADIVIEGYPGPGALGCTPESLRAILREVDSPAMAINFDPSHLIRMGIDPMRFLREFAPRVRHVHAKDTAVDGEAVYEFGREQPATLGKRVRFGGTFWRYTLPGHGQFAWSEGFEVLEQAGYQGYVTIELEDCNFNGSEEGERAGLLASRDYLKGC